MSFCFYLLRDKIDTHSVLISLFMPFEQYICTHVGVVDLVDFSQHLWVGLTEIWHLREYHTEPLIDARRYWLLQSSFLFPRT